MLKTTKKKTANTHCPSHALPLVKLPKSKVAVSACPAPGCSYVALCSEKVVQGVLGYRSQGKTENAQKETEAGRQERAIHLLQIMGYEVLETSEHRKKIMCGRTDSRGLLVPNSGCGKWFMPTGGRGVDYGIPDLLVRHLSRYPPYIWIGIEMKGDATPITPQQAYYIARMAYGVAYSAEEALAKVLYAEAFLTNAIEEWNKTVLSTLQELAEIDPQEVYDRHAFLLSARSALLVAQEEELRQVDAEINLMRGILK